VSTISAGGGLPVPYRETDATLDVARYFELWNTTRRRLSSEFQHDVRLEIEPGRYLVAESGYLIAQVRAVKQTGKNTFVLLDAGFHTLARPVLYGAYHPMAICPATGRTAHGTLVPVIVGGPLCESGDIFTQEEGGVVCTRELPTTHVGDYLIIGCAGAYGFSMASNYNSQPLPAEVLIDGPDCHLIRRRQEFAELYRGESTGLAAKHATP
jgi:diaminopimelate decarboxylase